MSPTSKKIVGGALALLFVVTIIQSQAITKIVKNINQESVPAVGKKITNTNYTDFSLNEDYLALAETQTAQVGGRGGGSCTGGIEVSTMSLPSYSLTDGDDDVYIYKFRVKNNNTSPTCILSIGSLDFVIVNATNANANFAKFYITDVATNTAFNGSPDKFISSFNRTFMNSTLNSPIEILPGQYIDLGLKADYIRNTNIIEEPGYDPTPEDYFMIGLSSFWAQINGSNASMSFVPARFDKKPIMVD